MNTAAIVRCAGCGGEFAVFGGTLSLCTSSDGKLYHQQCQPGVVVPPYEPHASAQLTEADVRRIVGEELIRTGLLLDRSNDL